MQLKVVFNVYQESNQEIINLVRKLRLLGYKDITCYFDGVNQHLLTEWLKQNKVDYVFNNYRLKAKNQGGLITQNYLVRFALSPCNCDYLIKIDPDTIPQKYLDAFPKTIGCNYNSEKRHIYGGCVVWSRSTAKTVVTSGYLLNPKYCNSKYNYYNHRLKEKVACQDLIIYDVLERLKIPIEAMKKHLYCRIKGERNETAAINQYCFIH